MQDLTTAKKTLRFENVYNVLWSTYDVFWQRTNISGLCNAKISNSGFRRYVWIVVFVLFSFLTLTGLINVIDDYMHHPVLTSVTVEHGNQVYTIVLLRTYMF